MSQANLPHASANSTTPPAKNNRASMPAPSRVTSASPPQSTFVNQPSPRSDIKAKAGAFGPTPEELETDAEGIAQGAKRATSIDGKRKSRTGIMDRNFKFPSSSSPSPPAIPELPLSKANVGDDDTGLMSVGVVAPSSVEVPPPPPVEKEKTGHVIEEGEEDVGETEEIALN